VYLTPAGRATPTPNPLKHEGPIQVAKGRYFCPRATEGMEAGTPKIYGTGPARRAQGTGGSRGGRS